MSIKKPYHSGEIAVQDEVGERSTAIRHGRIIADHFRPGALKFVVQQSMVALGGVDAKGHVWASALFGRRWFASAQPREVRFDFRDTDRDPKILFGCALNTRRKSECCLSTSRTGEGFE